MIFLFGLSLLQYISIFSLYLFSVYLFILIFTYLCFLVGLQFLATSMLPNYLGGVSVCEFGLFLAHTFF